MTDRDNSIRLKQAIKIMRTMLSAVRDAIIVVDSDGKLVYWNKSSEKMFGYSKLEAMKRPLHELIFPKRYREKYFKNLKVSLKEGKELFPGGIRRAYALKKNGEEFPIELSLSVINAGYKTNAIAIIRDITHQKHLEDKLKYLAFHDKLTGIYNRAYFEEEMERLNTKRNYPVVIVMIDVDKLKKVNDEFGHDVGDELLKALTEILRTITREEDVVARIGGDEFAVLLPHTDEKVAEAFYERFKRACDEYNKNTKLKLSASVGYALQRGQYKNMEEVLKEADRKMYEEKFSKRSPK